MLPGGTMLSSAAKRRRLAAFSAALLLLTGFAITNIARAAVAEDRTGNQTADEKTENKTGIRVHNGRLVEADGHDLVLRGINYPYTWYPTQVVPSLAGIKATGANAARLSLASGLRWPANSPAEITNIIALCRRNKLICVLDVHDTIVIGQEGAASTLAEAVDYWIRVKAALAGQEDYVIVNVGDEPYGNHEFGAWVNDASTAIRRLRAAGIRNTLMIDAPDWGQDGSFIMRDHARPVLAADPTGNTVFDIHMYGVFNKAPKVQAYLASFASHRLPIVIGEFGYYHPYGDPDEDAIMHFAQVYSVGYLGWSWSGNTDGVEYLDMVGNFDANRRTPWGVRFISGPDGLKTGSREASVYRSGWKKRLDAIAGMLPIQQHG
jgi:mannan endo-1,4-beta-mannosidase